MAVIPRSAALAAASSTTLASALSSVLGWVYTLAWSLSFYPQVVHNYTHASTLGLSTDFVFLNALGHTAYFVYNALLYAYKPVRRAYRKQHAGRDNVVQLNDFVFSLHAAVLALITLAQYLRYRKPDQGVSRTVQLGLAAVLTAVVFIAGAKRLKLVSWLQVVATASTIKLAVTLTKYLPQIKLNHHRKSTRGFAIENILLDLTGGVLSLAQLFVDAVWIQGSWSGVTGDWGKLGLGLLSIAFDVVLCWQHYALYGDADVEGEDEQDGQDGEDESANARYGSTPSRRAPRPNHGETNESSSLLR